MLVPIAVFYKHVENLGCGGLRSECPPTLYSLALLKMLCFSGTLFLFFVKKHTL